MDPAELYRGPLDDFVARRTALVRSLRSTDPDAARAAGKLRKPPLSVWAIDQLPAEHHDLVAELLAAAADAARAQRAAAAAPDSDEDLRLASARLRDGIEAAVRASAAGLRSAGHGAVDDVLRRIRTTLQAAATGSAEQRLALWHGSLDAEIQPAGFAALGDPEEDVPELAAVIAPLRRVALREQSGSRRGNARSPDDLRARRTAGRELAERQSAAVRARATAEAKRRQADRLGREARLADENATAAERAAEEAEDAARAP